MADAPVHAAVAAEHRTFPLRAVLDYNTFMRRRPRDGRREQRFGGLALLFPDLSYCSRKSRVTSSVY